MALSQSSWALYKRLFKYILPFWPMLLFGIVANMLYSGIDAGLTYMLRPFMDKSFIERDMAFALNIPLVIFFCVSIRGFVSGIGGYCMTHVARAVVKVFRQHVFRRLLQLPVSYYDKSPSGQLLSKLLYDVEQIAQVSADALTMFVQSVCLVVGLLIVMFVISWRLSLLFLLSVPVLLFIIQYTNKRTRKVSHLVQKTMGSVTNIAGEVIDGYQTVRIYGGQPYEEERFDKAIEESRKKDMKVAKIKVINVVGVQCVIALAIYVIVTLALYLSRNQMIISAGGFVSLVAAMLQLLKPMKDLSKLNSTIQRGLAGAESIFSLFDTPVEKESGQNELKRVKGNIDFREVVFAYSNNKPVIQNLNLNIRAGETVALVGVSGSGKSTLANLIPRFYELEDGDILIDGVSISSVKRTSLRKQIALVSQDIFLFNDTVEKNIAYGLSNCVKEDIIDAARRSYALSFIERLPKGFDTIVGENGVLLSGGQRQRLGIARALLKKAPILILDEATSALDNQAEIYIQKALDDVMGQCTTIVIAHRLSTVQKADKIVVLDKGRIVEMGKHDELLAANRHYASLYRLQFRETEERYEGV
jgi:subfamily B ATP-binding cassette protein MsbA